MHVFEGGSTRFSAVKARPIKQAARKLPKALSRKVIKAHLAKTKAKAAKAIHHAQRHVKRLGTAKLMDYGALPWAEHQTRPLHMTGKGTGKIRDVAAHGALETAKGVYTLADRLNQKTKKQRDQIKDTAKSVKGSRMIYRSLGETRFKAIVTPKGKMQETIARHRVKILNRVEAVSKRVGNVGKHVKTVADYSGAILKGELGHHASQKMMEAATKKAQFKVAERVALKAGGKAALKGAGRFVPGANIAMAGVDAMRAYKTLRDPNASTYKKAMTLVTAGFSAVAATNIPVVSQIAAGLSLVSSVAENLNPKKIKKALKKVGKFFGFGKHKKKHAVAK